jgi:hypothetical protein
MNAIDELVAGQRERVELQPIEWRRANWEGVWEADSELPGRAVLDAIDTEVAGDGAGSIRRSWVRSLADGDPAVFLAGSTIWGFGSYVRRGRPALRAMLRTPGADVIVREIVAAARTDAGRGFSALFAGGRSRISSLGIAFGTKLVHFAGYDYAEPRPLILDARVFAAAHTLDPLAPVPNPARYTTGEQYRTYCEWAGDVATRNDVEPEDVEYALFVYAGR